MKAAVSSVCRVSLAAVLAFALGMGAFAPTTRVQAATKSGHQFTYYNNAQHQTVVGVYIYCSNGQFIHTGKISDYVVVSPSGC